MAGTTHEANVVEACGAAYRDSSGKAQGFLLPQLSKSLASDVEFSLPPNAPTNILGIQCRRQSLAPLLSDVKVIAAGYPFTILSGGRIGTLEIVDGRLRFNMIDGEMTDLEVEQIGTILDDGQQYLLDLESREQQPVDAKVAP
jgi:hypothetical protein